MPRAAIEVGQPRPVVASSRQVTLRTAAYMLGVGRVSRATVLGGVG